MDRTRREPRQHNGITLHGPHIFHMMSSLQLMWQFFQIKVSQVNLWSLVESHTDPFFSTPNDVTWPFQLLGWNIQREVVGDKHR